MLPQERQHEIMEQLQKKHIVKIADISKILNVTRETIRKDLYELEARGLVHKIHGGAIINKANNETSYVHRKIINEVEKRSIAKQAAQFVEDGDILYIDYGTTTLFFTQEILKKKGLTVVTNSLPVANELMAHSMFDVIVIGGHLRKNEKSLSGPIACRGIEKINVDKGFFSIGAVDIDAGYTNIHVGETEISRLMLKHSHRKFLMADYSKFNKVARNKVAAIEEIEVLITDVKTNQTILAQIEGKNTIIVVCEE
ncbi:DeoR/GlpR transcriptional regulator [Lysinibacillus macroides]|uniref:Lactose phosphotransferase system repressor n=1 Tax=Lysinibacillus macroides TaxID=33935 RepID=A0A0N0CWC4_9BACI|nr:DeoR/GlpR family DNA-binding transcription regulator [Lysinibacillus macroides]KOY82924.1 hypothetical protein ADM90_06280 [Lysinibacillus macroides]QPR70226.1 DeoR/GlpR transcriptional regulator [Lysinibacillus macroides]